MKTKPIKSKPGIRIKENGKFIVFKLVAGKRRTKEFFTLREAEAWKSDNDSFDLKVNGKSPALNENGITFQDVYAQYLEEGMVELTDYTIYKKKLRMSHFLPNLFQVKMSEMNGRIILKHLQDMKLLVSSDSKRCNFDKELKDLSSIFNWYDEEISPFANPIRRKHFKAGRIKTVERSKKDLPPEALPEVGAYMRKELRYLMLIQFLLGARIGEASAINDQTIDFNRGTIDLTETIVWIKGKAHHVKGTKTNNPNKKVMTPLIREMLLELKNERPAGCKFFFHHKGKMLRYQMIREELNKALIQSGYGDYSGTHILRHSMGSYSRKEAGLDTAQAMLSHSSARQTEGYARLDVNEKVTGVILRAEKLFSKSVTKV
jgi:integrase